MQSGLEAAVKALGEAVTVTQQAHIGMSEQLSACQPKLSSGQCAWAVWSLLIIWAFVSLDMWRVMASMCID